MGIFAKIAAGEIPSYKCAANDEFYAFLDINPMVKGHTLVIPRREVDYIFDMDDDEIARFQVFAKKVAQAIKAAFPCVKVGGGCAGARGASCAHTPRADAVGEGHELLGSETQAQR